MSFNQEKKLLTYIAKMSFVDILGFANIVGTEIVKDEDFEDYIARLIVDF